jgi:hypothetical protein
MAWSHTNNLPTPTDLTKNHYGRNLFFKTDDQKKSATVILFGIAIEFVPPRPIFEKMFSSSI